MSQPRDDRQDDLFRPPLETIINLRHPLVRLAGELDWDFLAGRFGSVCRAGPGQPPLPTRLVAGLLILKHMHNLFDEALCDRWVENPYFQYFCGEVVFRHELPFDRSSLTRWRTGAWKLQIVKRSDAPGFEVLPKRWIVERTFAWISRNRRLARDFERYATTVTAFVRIAMIRIMLKRLAANTSS